jgi:hypothetical protein
VRAVYPNVAGKVAACSWLALPLRKVPTMASQLYVSTTMLPPVDNVHQVLTAYLRTSELGDWKLDPDQQSDGFVMHFMRGKWAKSMFGRIKPGMADRTSDMQLIPRTVPMRLCATLRPSPQDVTIRLDVEVFTEDGISLSDLKREWGQKMFVRQWEEMLRQELSGLREYLKKCYDLPELPLLASE